MVFAPLEIGAIIQMHSLKNSKPNSRSNTMNRYRFATTVLLVILAAGTCMAQVDVPKTLGNLDAYGIKMFRINSNARDFTMDLVVTTTNANAEAIKLRTGDFDVIFQGQAYHARQNRKPARSVRSGNDGPDWATESGKLSEDS
jgi:hypothetical protein